MKKTISLLLAFLILFSVTAPAFAADTDPEYYTVPVEYSDNIGQHEQLDLMIQNDHVFVNAKMIAERFGYSFDAGDKGAVIYNKELSLDLPVSITQFQYNSTRVSHMVFNNMVDTYEAPFASVKNSEGVWIPLKYSLLLLNSSVMITDSALLIDVPDKRLVDRFYDIAKNAERFSFDWASDIGYSEKAIKTLGGSSHLVNVFNGLLEFDGDSWAALFQQSTFRMDSYDKKYGENLALLLCTQSDKELQAATEKVETISDLLNVDGDLGQLLSFTSDMNEFQVESLYRQCETVLDGIKAGNTSIVAYNRSYQALEKALDRQTWFSHTGENILTVQQGVSKATGKVFTVLDYATKAAEICGYAEEFQNQDQFSLAALSHYLETANDGLELPEAMRASMTNYSAALSGNVLGYTAKRLWDNIDQWAVDAVKDNVPLYKILGAQAAAALIAWDIASSTIPFITNGLSSADSFELSLYSEVFQGDTYLNYLSRRDSVFSDAGKITAENLYNVAQYCYIYLKTCYVTREAALASLSNLSSETKEAIRPLVEYQNSINAEIAEILVELRGANSTNDEGVFGFLPADSDKYLTEHDDSKLIQWAQTIKPEDYGNIYEDFLITQGYKPFISDWMHEVPSEYAILDINGDRIEDLIITGGSSGFYNFAVFSFDPASNEIYVISIPGSAVFGDDYTGNVAQYYGSLQYSPQYHALVYTELNNGFMFDSYGYCVIHDQQLIPDFSLWYERDYHTQQISYGISDSDHLQTISKENFDSYIQESVNLEWIKIPTSASGDWKQAYINYVKKRGTEYDSFGHAMEIYKLVNINNDSIPELYINFGTTAGGDVICTYNDGIIEKTMWNYGLSYIEGQNLFRDAGGQMDAYYDKIYSIENGQFVLHHEGEYGVPDNASVQFDSYGYPIYHYYWNKAELSSEAEYMNLLNSVYDTQKAITPFDGATYSGEASRYIGNALCNYGEIIEAINAY